MQMEMTRTPPTGANTMMSSCMNWESVEGGGGGGRDGRGMGKKDTKYSGMHQ